MRKTASTSNGCSKNVPFNGNHQKINQNPYWTGSTPALYEIGFNCPSSSFDRDKSPPAYYYQSSTSVNNPRAPVVSSSNTTVTTTLRSNKDQPSRMNFREESTCDRPLPANGFGRRHTATGHEFKDSTSISPIPTYLTEHLASFAVGGQFGLVSPADGVRKLKQMELNSAICPVPMLFTLHSNRIAILDQSNNLVEEFPLTLVTDPTAHTSTEREPFNNILLFIVLEHNSSDGVSKVPAEMHIFQCTNDSAHNVAEDLYHYVRGQFHKVRKRNAVDLHKVANHNQRLLSEQMPRGKYGEEFDDDFPSNDSSEYFEMDVNTLNRCFDDIEHFVARVQSVALAQRELEMQKLRIKQNKSGKKAKEAVKAAQNGILRLRAQIPHFEEFAEIFQKFKLCFNLLAKLRKHIHEPSATELVHFLFTPLTVLLDACQWGLGEQVAQQIYAPLLSLEACELLHSCLYPKEMEIWNALGIAWNTPPEEWAGALPQPYRPVFSDGFAPYGVPNRQNVVETAPRVRAQETQFRQRYPSVPAIHRGISAPVQSNSRFYQQCDSRPDYDSPLRAAKDNIELQRINLEKERLDLERRKVLEKERALFEQERRLDEEKERFEREKRQLHKDSEKRSVGSERSDFHPGPTSLQTSPRIGRRSGGSGQDNGQQTPSPVAFMRHQSPSSLDIEHQSPRQRAYLGELMHRGSMMVQVTYDRLAQNPKELAVARGEYLEVLNDAKNWWECKNVNGRSGYVPHTILTVISPADINAYSDNNPVGDASAVDYNEMLQPSGNSTPDYISQRRGKNGEFRYF